MAVEYSLYTEKYQDKERLVTALTNSGYIVSAVILYDGIRHIGYRVDIYTLETPKDEKKTIGFAGEQ